MRATEDGVLPRVLTTRTPQKAYALLGIILLWQTNVFVHLVTTQHEIREDGTIVQSRHIPHSTDQAHHRFDKQMPSDAPPRKDRGHGCTLLASLISPTATATGFYTTGVTNPPDFRQLEIPKQEMRPYRHEALFLLSPSQSPPV